MTKTFDVFQPLSNSTFIDRSKLKEILLKIVVEITKDDTLLFSKKNTIISKRTLKEIVLNRNNIQEIRKKLKESLYNQSLLEIKNNSLNKFELVSFSGKEFIFKKNSIFVKVNKNNLVPNEKFFRNIKYYFFTRIDENNNINLDRKSIEFISELVLIKTGIKPIDVFRIPGINSMIVIDKESEDKFLGIKKINLKNIKDEIGSEIIEYSFLNESFSSFCKRSYDISVKEIQIIENQIEKSKLFIFKTKKDMHRIILNNNFRIAFIKKFFDLKICFFTTETSLFDFKIKLVEKLTEEGIEVKKARKITEEFICSNGIKDISKINIKDLINFYENEHKQ